MHTHPIARHLPAALTLANLLAGAAALGAVATGQPLWWAAAFVGAGLVCDLFDGRAARALNVSGPQGAMLDSLADLVTFGVTPALTLYAWKLHAAGPLGLLATGALIAAAATRLARFTVAADGPKPAGPARFSGLAVTIPAAVALGAVSADLPVAPRVVALAGLALAALMVSSLPYRSFKDRSVAVVAVPAVVLMTLSVLATQSLALGLGLAAVLGGLGYALSAPVSRLGRHLHG